MINFVVTGNQTRYLSVTGLLTTKPHQQPVFNWAFHGLLFNFKSSTRNLMPVTNASNKQQATS